MPLEDHDQIIQNTERIAMTTDMIKSHIKECRAARKEARMMWLSVLGTVIAAIVIALIKMPG